MKQFVSPQAITVGAEWQVNLNMSLTCNTPYNIQTQRLRHLERVGVRYSMTSYNPSGHNKRSSLSNFDDKKVLASKDFSSLVFEKNILPKPTKTRPKPKFHYCIPNFDDQPKGFVAKPHDDIPKNKLTEKLMRGIQSFVSRM